jgi:site-specific DNA-methyltransferase (adenine-specific)
LTPLLITSLPPLDTRNVGCGLALLRAIPDEFTPLAFFDAQFRAVLDKLALGNEGARQRHRVALPQMSESLIRDFGREIARVLMPSGYCAFWTDKFGLATGLVAIPGLQVVDLLVWDTGGFGMGHRTRHRGEPLVFLQRPPIAARSARLLRPWRATPSIPDVWVEKIVDRRHPHQKAARLIRALIEALTLPGDVVVDPAAGSFVVMDAALAAGRHFLGTDLVMPAPTVMPTSSVITRGRP